MNVTEIVFSPAGGTEKVAHIIAAQWCESPSKIDLCDAKTDFAKCEISRQDMVLIAMPSFGGRAPAVAIERKEGQRHDGVGRRIGHQKGLLSQKRE